MKVGIILRVLWPAGGPRTAIEETRCLTQLGLEVTLLICRQSNYQYQYGELLSNLSNVKIVTKGIKGLIFDVLSSPVYPLFPKGVRGWESKIDIPSLITLPLILSKSSVDVLLCHDQFAGISGYLASKMKGIPYFIRVHEKPTKFGGIAGITPEELSLRSRLLYKVICNMETRIFGEASCLIANSRQCADYMRTYLKRKSRIEVIYPGCNPVAKPDLDKGNYVLALSRWDRGRRPEFILDIAQKVERASFIIAGAFSPPSFEIEFRREVAAKNLTNRVKMMPQLPEKTIEELYSHAAVYVRWGDEAFGAGVIEAASHACPVVVQREAGASELIEHGVQGFIVNGCDAEGFAHHVQALLNDGEMAARMGLNAWELSKEYSWESHAAKLKGLLEEIVGG